MPREAALRFNTDSAHYEPKAGTFPDRPNLEHQPNTGHTTRRMSAWGALKVISTENPLAQRVFEALRKQANQMRKAVARGVDFRLLNIEDIRHLRVSGKDHVFIPFTGHRNGYQLVLAAYLPSDGAPVQIYLQETTPTEQIREGTAYHLRYYSLDMTAINVLPADSRLNNVKKQCAVLTPNITSNIGSTENENNNSSSGREGGSSSEGENDPPSGSGGGCGGGGSGASRLPTITLPPLVITAPRYTPSRTFYIPRIPFMPRFPSPIPRVPPGYGPSGFSGGSGSTGRGGASAQITNKLTGRVVQIINNLTGKALCVYNKLQRLSGGFKKAIQKFDGEFPVSHLEFNMSSNLADNVGAITSSPSNYIITIKINSNNLNRPNLSIARDIIHETIHAEMYRKLLSLVRQGSLSGVTSITQINGLQSNFPGLFDYYTRYKGQGGGSHPQHQQMAAHYRNSMVNMLKQFEPGQPEGVYQALAWVGLMGSGTPNGYTGLPPNPTRAWSSLSRANRLRIIREIQNFNRTGTKTCP